MKDYALSVLLEKNEGSIRENMLLILEDLGLKRISEDIAYADYEIFIGQITIQNTICRIYIDTSSYRWRFTGDVHPLYATEDDMIIDFNVTVPDLIKVLMDYSFKRGEINKCSEIKKSLDVN